MRNLAWMNGIHDMGGMDGFGAIPREAEEPVFHADWERRVFAIASTLIRRGLANVDEFRHLIERLPPAEYLRSPYYQRWLYAIETLLLEKRIVSSEELARHGVSIVPAIAAASFDPQGASRGSRARFKAGDNVTVDTRSPLGHTRCPRYVRGRQGVIARDWGVYVYPDSNAHHAGDYSQHVYSVAFTARELWGTGTPARETVLIDLWESYLRHTAPTRRSKVRKSAARPVKARIAKKK